MRKEIAYYSDDWNDNWVQIFWSVDLGCYVYDACIDNKEIYNARFTNETKELISSYQMEKI